MGLRSLLLVTLVPAALAAAASCAPLQGFDAGTFRPGGSLGGSISGISSANGTGTGTGGGPTTDAGPAPAGMGPLRYLCGGSHAQCSPDPGSQDCTPGGNAGLGGSGAGGASPASDAAALTCQLVGTGTQVAAVCGMAGTTAEDVPCKETADCQAGLGCVQVAGVSLCRPYCCGSLESCAPKTYCSPVPLAEAPKFDIPVCIKVQDCKLLVDSTCTGNQTCTIVRADGTTSCVDAGTGTQEQHCPCAAGYICSWTDNICHKLCHTNADCDAGFLCQQGPSQFPDNIGYCVTLN